MPFPPDPATTEWVPLYSKNAFRGADGDPGVAGPAGPQSIGFVLDGEPGEDGMMIPGTNGTNGVGVAWELITTRTMTGNSQEAFTGLAGYTQLAVVGRNVTRSAAALTQWRASSDNGATYPSTSIYGTLSAAGAESYGTQYDCFSSAGTSARSWTTYIYSNTASSPKILYNSLTTTTAIIDMNAAVNALLFFASSGTLNGGTISIYGLKPIAVAAASSAYPSVSYTRPVDADFSWINQGGASVTTTVDSGISLTAPANTGQSYRCRVKTAPATPYTITAAFKFNWFIAGNTQVGGLMFRESATGEIASLVFGRTGSGVGIKVTKNDSPTVFNAFYVDGTQGGTGGVMSQMWLRIQDNGTNRICAYSLDGFYWVTVHTIGRTDFLTADQVGFCISEQSNTGDINLLLQSWAQS